MKTFWLVEDAKGIVAMVFTEEKARLIQAEETNATITEKLFEEWDELEKKAQKQDQEGR